MNHIWTYIHNKKWNVERKNGLFLFLTTFLSAAFGLLIWFVLHFFAYNELPWAICFAGYPGFFFGLIGGVLYLYHHSF